MTNADLCLKMFALLREYQVETVVVCAGARNAPLVMHLDQSDASKNFKKVYFFEERSAAFYALGCLKQSGKAAAVITTSGTAAAELLPATIEAYYQGLPLILITADRPKAYRNSGAPQTINQVGLFSHYVEKSYDWDIHESDTTILSRLDKPLHFNICFDEPLMDLSSQSKIELSILKSAKSQFPEAQSLDFTQIKKPLLIIGQLEEKDKLPVISFIQKLKAPVYLEALSQLQGEKAIEDYVLSSSDILVKKAFEHRACESVIRIGGIPTLRFWRDLEAGYKNTPVFNFTDIPFSGLSRSSANFSLGFLHAASVETFPADRLKFLKIQDQQLQALKITLLQRFPLSEQAFVHRLSQVIHGDPIYIGNSLPIREWDSFADLAETRNQKVYANRGANGIDGQISTYLGWSNGLSLSWCFIGDLTAMYDLAALGLVHSTTQSSPVEMRRLVVMNNFGGQIFKRVFKNDHFLNSHQIEFSSWAEMWKWDYQKVQAPEDFEMMSGQNIIVEIQPDAQQTESFWHLWDEACIKI